MVAPDSPAIAVQSISAADKTCNTSGNPWEGSPETFIRKRMNYVM